MVLSSLDIWALIVLAIAIIPIIGLMVYAIVIAVRRSVKVEKIREKEISESTDQTQYELFMNAYGGKENIKNVKRELSRVIVEVNDLEKVNADEFKNLGATGVYIAGNVIKCSFGDRAPYIYNILMSGKYANDKQN